MSAVAWAYFQDLAVTIRQTNPEAQVLEGDQGVRQVLRTWLEEQIREEVG